MQIDVNDNEARIVIAGLAQQLADYARDRYCKPVMSRPVVEKFAERLKACAAALGPAE